MFYLLAEGLSAEGLGPVLEKPQEQIAFQTFTTLTTNSDLDALVAQMSFWW